MYCQPTCIIPKNDLLQSHCSSFVILSYCALVCICICMCVCVCIYIYIYIYQCVCVCVCLHTHTNTHVLIPLSILRQVSSLFQSEFSIECDLVLPFQFPVSSSSCFYLLPRLSVTSILPCAFPSITCKRRQLLCKMRPIQLDFFIYIYICYKVAQ